MREIEEISVTIRAIAEPGMKPKELIAKVRRQHRSASKKDITRAAFYAVIAASENAPDSVRDLHDLAMETRNSHDDDLSEADK